RLGIVASRKLGGAVRRNLAKRLIREIFRRNKPAPGVDVIVMPRRELCDTALASLEEDYGVILRRYAKRAR
ncbi:MAG: ribonuclease P protein component, partial [Acidobacteria bacterium]|nr:ribonuclease P protein component [Acidobacteriota bacterium]